MIELSPGYRISRLIKGGWQLAGGHGPIDKANAVKDMFAYAEAGITTFDCADIYTGVEELIGSFLREWRAVHPSLPLQVHTKYVPDLESLATLKPEAVEATIDRSLQRLGVPMLDLVQFHWWDFDQPGYVETAGVLGELRRKGKIRNVGTTNFDAERLRQLLDAGVPVVSNQVQYSLLDRRPAGALSRLCAASGVKLLCYGALAGGFLSPKWLGQAEPQEPQENRSLTKYKLIIEEAGGWGHFQELLRALTSIGAKHGVSCGAVALRWTLDQPQVAAAIAGARSAAHLRGTLEALTFSFDDADRASLRAILAKEPGPAGEIYALEREKGGRHARIMKTNLNRS
ncbi:MAG TPA: aldo/keto reductase [Myxococcales bacterium]|nr:aldo/keto reductase [Myxococcales bacterium]